MEFYYSNNILGNQILLDEDETNHLVKVKRFKSGEKVQVTDGLGTIYLSALTRVDKRQAVLEVLEKSLFKKRPYQLHIAIAPTKNIDRTEWFVEKATESGIEEITFLNCAHSERKIIKEERMQKVMISAMKQSLKPYAPVLHPLIGLKEFVTQQQNGTKVICATSAPFTSTLHKNYQKGNSLIVLIGPEGDFNESEIHLAVTNDFQLTTLGESRLRTETAAISVCTIYNFINL
jgi:16S rRNA (uracil1498-N3)-methyltransferase